MEQIWEKVDMAAGGGFGEYSLALLMNVTFVAAFLNLLLLGAVLYPSTRNFLKTRSAIAAGLMLFVVLFLIENVTAVYFHVTMMYLYAPPLEFQAMVLRLIQTVSFGTLLWVTYK